MKVLILYSELAGYIVKCMEELSTRTGVLVTVVNWPVNKEAPFQFNEGAIDYRSRSDFDNAQLLEFAIELSPDIIISSGWMDKGYNGVCKSFKNKIPVVACFDNHWTGSVKQKLVSMISKVVIRDKFNRAWVPGEIQAKYARKLGFKKSEISKGFYAADTQMFNAYYGKYSAAKKNIFPKRLLFVGRYVEHKGIFEMWRAFVKLKQQDEFQDWELWCVGTGDQWDNKIQSEGIKHLGFKQPDEFDEIIKNTSIYILPSKFEPWGVSLQEFAVAGYPIVASKAVGSTEAFCNVKNSFIFNHNNNTELKIRLAEAMRLSQSEYAKMSDESHRIGSLITARGWSDTIINITNGKN
jgi:glycosyltransferase involved in cell wall biosynthesis